MGNYIVGGIIGLALAAAVWKRLRAWREGRCCGCGSVDCPGRKKRKDARLSKK